MFDLFSSYFSLSCCIGLGIGSKHCAFFFSGISRFVTLGHNKVVSSSALSSVIGSDQVLDLLLPLWLNFSGLSQPCLIPVAL